MLTPGIVGVEDTIPPRLAPSDVRVDDSGGDLFATQRRSAEPYVDPRLISRVHALTHKPSREDCEA